MTGWQRSATAHSLHTFDVALRTRGRGTWRTFSDPIAIFQALEPDDVPGCLTAIDRAVEGGGYAAGFLAYEAAAAFGLSTHRRRAGFLPLVCFGIYPPEHVMSVTRPAPREPYRLDEWRPSMRPEAYASAIRRIESREVPQAVLTLRLHAAFEGEPRTLMADLDAARGGWMSAFIDAGTHAICSASPELLFAIEGRTVECRPVSGRYPRGLSSTADRRHSDWLRDSEASRAEHAAIADAVRAALERVADAGTVEWRSRFEIERSPLFWQMASTVSGRVRRPTLAHLVAALFPSAAVTGVPKDRAMEAITEVESTSRGAQTGAIGYLSPRGRGRLSVAHQSVVIDREQRDAEIGIERTVSPAGRALDEYAVSLAEAAMLFPSSPGGRDQAGVVRIVSYVTAPRPDVRLLETIKWTPADGFVLLDRHVARLGESAACFGFECDLVEVRRVLAAAVEDLKAPAKVRILLSRDGAIACEAIDLAEEDPGPLRVAFARDPIDARDVFLYHQTTRRAVYDRARASRPDADAVLLWNVDGEVTEATGWNVVVQVNGRNITPPVDAGLLPGTLRAELLALGELVEQRITRDELRRAERIWLINSLRGWVEVLMVD